MMDWNRLAETFATNTAPVLLALGALFKILQKNQNVIKKQLDGHTKMLARAKKAEGKYEGTREAKNDSRHDQDVILKAVKEAMAAHAAASKRGTRRTDK
jgi:hypothetical protein